jgi:chromosomal replication initiator protein
MFFARKLTNQSLPDIGKRFGGRDHSTVIHAIKSVEKRLSEDPYLEIEVEVLRERLSTGELPQKPIVSWMQESEPCKVLA